MGGKSSRPKEGKGGQPSPSTAAIDQNANERYDTPINSANDQNTTSNALMTDPNQNGVSPSVAVTGFDVPPGSPAPPSRFQSYKTQSLQPIPEYGTMSENRERNQRGPPKREVEQSHHHHHIITVDSETDFAIMDVDEKKVNYLPYNPPIAISQTGLIQSIGRPFSKNHARYLPDPGDEFKLTRRVSQVKLYQVELLGDVNTKTITSLTATLKLLSIIIGTTGLVFFCFMLSIAAISTPMEYSNYFLDTTPICKAIHIFGAVQPFGVAPYCRYALINLKYVRTYFLRVPIWLVLPVAVVGCGLSQISEVVSPNGDMNQFLYAQIENYAENTFMSRDARITMDGIQNTFSCCGNKDHNDWKNRNSANSSQYPHSCCVVIIILEVISVLTMKSLHECIHKELYDERSSLSIMWGKMCSLCDIQSTDEEMEYDEIVDHDNDSDENGHHSKHQTFSKISNKRTPATSRVTSKAASKVTSKVPSKVTSKAPSKVGGSKRNSGMGLGTINKSKSNKVAPK